MPIPRRSSSLRRTSSQLSTSLTTDKSVYQLGQPISLTFTETNVGTTPIEVLVRPPSFNITQNGALVWTSSFPNSLRLAG